MRANKPASRGPARPSASPAVSVVMSVYNGERFLHEAVDSVLAQSFSDFELLVVDDGSTDSTARILAEYASSDPRVIVHRQANQGSPAALNLGFSLARAPLVARMDADDVAVPDRLERQQRFLAEHETVALLGGAVTLVDESGRAFAEVQYPLSDAEIREAFAYTTPFVHSAVMLRKETFERLGGYRPIFDPAEDVDLWLRIAEGYELANLTELVVRYRMHADQATVRRLERQALCCVAAYAAARVRREGRPDPFDTAERIDEETLLTHGTSNEEITAAVVRSATWLAKTMGRAGYTEVAEGLFAKADAMARSDSGSRALVASVHRALARRYAEQGSRLRATLQTLRAVLAERAG